MKRHFIKILISLLVLTSLFSSPKQSEALPQASSNHLWPSIRTGIMQSTYDEFNAQHYDWIAYGDGDPKWYAANPNVFMGYYNKWTWFPLLGDIDGNSSIDPMEKWYSWAAKNNVDWENAMLHLTSQDTYFNLTDQSCGNCRTWFDSAFRYLWKNIPPWEDQFSTTNGIKAATGNWVWTEYDPNGMTVGANDTIYFGRLDRFNEVNFTYSTPPPSGWNVTWQYWDGSSWANLTVTQKDVNAIYPGNPDGISAVYQFNPPSPSSWKRRTIPDQNGQPRPLRWGDQGVYFIRLINNSSTGPVLKKVNSRHFWAHGADGNTVPAWDPANDKNGDGFVDDSEYSTRANTNASARYKYESRIPQVWEWDYVAANMGNSDFRQKMGDFAVEVLDGFKSQGKNFAGTMQDDGSCGIPNWWQGNFDPAYKILEYPGLDKAAAETKNKQDCVGLWQATINIVHNGGYLVGSNVGQGGYAPVESLLDNHIREANYTNSSGKTSNPWGWVSWEINPAVPDAAYYWDTNQPWMKYSDQGKPMFYQWQLDMYEKTQLGDYLKQVTVTNGSKTMTGIGTNWTETLELGSSIYVQNTSGGWDRADVASVDSNTQVTLNTPWSFASGTRQHFALTTRDKMDGLTTFMVIQRAANDYFSLAYGAHYRGGDGLLWFDPEGLDYGDPTDIVPAGKEARGSAYRKPYVFDKRPDPSGGDAYVYARDYTKALALNRPKSNSDSSYLKNSSITYDLPANETWYQVDYLGKISATPTTKVTLRGGEGAIIMKGSALQGVNLYKKADKATGSSGETITYTISYKNGINLSKAARIEDNLPVGTTFLTCSNSCTNTAGKITWNLGDLAQFASGQVSLQVKIP